MRVIVTGASGFIGRNLVGMVPHDWSVVALYNRSADFPNFVRTNCPENVTPHRCDLTSESQLKLLRTKYGHDYDLCIHLAANGNPSLSVEDPLYDAKSNIDAMILLLEALTFGRFLFVSSGAVYEGCKGLVNPGCNVSPTLAYAISKLAAENYVRFFSRRKRSIKEFLIVRFFGAYGPYEPAYKIHSRLVTQFCFNQKMEFEIRGDGHNLIDAMYVDDAVSGLIKMSRSQAADRVVDFCAGRPLEIDCLVKKAARVFAIDQPTLRHRGEVAEYNLFHASPRTVEDLFDFGTTVELESGLKMLARFLEKSRPDESHNL